MIISIALVFFVIFLAIVLTGIFLLYLKVRAVSNSFLAVAGHDFHEKASALFETADELPDEVLNHIEFLNRTALNRKTPFDFYKKLRAYNRSEGAQTPVNNERFQQFERSVSGMREELQELQSEMDALWMNWLINQNVLIGFLIALELRKIKARTGHLNDNTESVGANVYTRIDGEFC